MSEKTTIQNLKLKYTGYFDLNELYNIIEQWLSEMGYTKNEQEHRVQRMKDGVHLVIVSQPSRTINDYIQHALKVYIIGDKIQEKVIDVDGTKKRVYGGTLNLAIKAIEITDYEGKWKMSPMTYFFRTVFEKFIYTGYMKDYTSVLKEQAAGLYNEMSAYLNTNKYRFRQEHKETMIGSSQ